jgi:hypothetical protein
LAANPPLWFLVAPLGRPDEQALASQQDTTFDVLHRIATVCNNAYFESKSVKPRLQDPGAALPRGSVYSVASLGPEDGEESASRFQSTEYYGSPSEVALLRFCNLLRSARRVRSRFPVVFEIPFNSRNKWHLVIVRQPGSSTHYTVFMKGAPEIIMGKCSTVMAKGATSPLDDAFRGQFQVGSPERNPHQGKASFLMTRVYGGGGHRRRTTALVLPAAACWALPFCASRPQRTLCLTLMPATSP